MAIQTAEKLANARSAIVNAITAKGGTAAADATLYECAGAISNLTVQSVEENDVLDGDYSVTLTSGSGSGVYVGVAAGYDIQGNADVKLTGGSASILMATRGAGSITGNVTETVESSGVGSLRGIFGHRGETFSDDDLMTVDGDFHLWIKSGQILRPAGYSAPNSEYQSGITGLVCYAKVKGDVTLTLDDGTLGDVRLSGNKSYVEGDTQIQLNGGTVTGNFYGVNRGYWKDVSINLAGSTAGTVFGYRAYNRTNNFQGVEGNLAISASAGSAAAIYAVSSGITATQSEAFQAEISGGVTVAISGNADVKQCVLLDKADVPQPASVTMTGGTAETLALLSPGSFVETASVSATICGGTVKTLLTALNGSSSVYKGPGVTMSVSGGCVKEIAPVYGSCHSNVTLNLSGGSVTESSDVSGGLSMGPGTVYGNEVWNISGSFFSKFASSRGNCRKTTAGTGGNFTVNMSGGQISQFRLGQGGVIEGGCFVNVSGGSVNNLYGGNGPQTIQGDLVFTFSGGTVNEAYGKYNAGTVQGSMKAVLSGNAKVGKMVFVNQGAFAGNVIAECSGGTVGNLIAQNTPGSIAGDAILRLHNTAPLAATAVKGFTVWETVIDGALFGTQCSSVNTGDAPSKINVVLTADVLSSGIGSRHELAKSTVLVSGSPQIGVTCDGAALQVDADGWITGNAECSGCRVWIDNDTFCFGKP